jgi:hypothetical protein
MEAYQARLVGMLGCLITAGICASAADIDRAAWKGDLPAVKAILARSPELLESENANGATPLHLASIQGHDDLVAYLLTHGASLTAKDRLGYTPLHWAAYKGRNRSRRLFSHGPVRRLQNRVGIDTRQSQHLET